MFQLPNAQATNDMTMLHNKPGTSDLTEPLRHVSCHYHQRILQLTIDFGRKLTADKLVLTQQRPARGLLKNQHGTRCLDQNN